MVSVVFGHTGGIGAALARGLAARGEGPVIGVSRSAAGEMEGVTSLVCDLADEAALAEVSSHVKSLGPVERVIIAVGLLSDGATLQPEKSFRHQEMDAFRRVFEANTFIPALIAKQMIPILPREGRCVLAALSARVGSISDNRLGGWHAYRASKAALNMLIANYSIEQQRRNAQFIAVGLHPGTVDTSLSKPFQGNVPDRKLFTPDQSAEKLLDVLDALTPEQSGRVYDYNGELIAP